MWLQLGGEGGDAGDRVGGAEEGAGAGDEVDAAVEEEAALVGGVFAPGGFCFVGDVVSAVAIVSCGVGRVDCRKAPSMTGPLSKPNGNVEKNDSP